MSTGRRKPRLLRALHRNFDDIILKMKYFIFGLVVAIVFVLIFLFWPAPAASVRDNFVTIRGQKFIVEIARTSEEQSRGLSGHAPLAPDEGMLFPFPPGSTPGFWMKDMLFPIDIVWIADGRVVGFVEHAAPDDRPNRMTYYPPQPVTEVLEVAAGTVGRLGIQIGDGVSF